MSGRNNDSRGRGSHKGRGRGGRNYNRYWGNTQNNNGGRSENIRQRPPYRGGRNNYRPPAVRFGNNPTRNNKSTLNNNNNNTAVNNKRKVEGSSGSYTLANNNNNNNNDGKLMPYDPQDVLASLERMNVFQNNIITHSVVIDNPPAQQAIIRQLRREEVDGVVKETYKREYPKFDMKTFDSNKIIKVNVPVQAISDEMYATFVDEEMAKHDAIENAEVAKNQIEREAALQTYRLGRVGTVGYNNLGIGFVWRDYIPRLFIPPPRLPELVEETVVSDKGISVRKVRNRVEQMLAIKDIEDQSCQEIQEYKKQLEAENKLIIKYSSNYNSDKQKLWSIIWDLLSTQVQNDVLNYIKVHQPTLQIEEWRNRFDYISLLDIIDATVHPFYLHNHDKEKTTEVLRSLVRSLSNDSYLTRKDHETFKAYFARYSTVFSYLSQLSKLLNESAPNEQQFIFNLFKYMRPTDGTNMHTIITGINNSTAPQHRKSTLAEQIAFLSDKCQNDDQMINDKIKEKKIQRNHDRDHEYKRRRNNDYGHNKNNNNSDRDATNNSLLNQERADDGNILVSIQDLLEVDISTEKLKELMNKKKPTNTFNNNNSDPTKPSSSNDTKPSAPRPFMPKYNNNGNNSNNNNSGGFSRKVASANRGSQPRGDQSFFNFDDGDNYNNFTIEEEESNVPDNVLSTITDPNVRPMKRRRMVQDLRSCDKNVLILDNGNNTSHMIVNDKMLMNGPQDFQNGAGPKISGQDKNWTITHKQYGHHRLFGMSIYNPGGRVNLINPELLTHDGWSLQVYTDIYGEFAHIYNRKFSNGKNYVLEFIRNKEGHLVASDPSLDFDFEPPSSRESQTLGDISSLRRFMADKQSERLEMYYNSKNQPSHYQEDYYFENDEDGRHRHQSSHAN